VRNQKTEGLIWGKQPTLWDESVKKQRVEKKLISVKKGGEGKKGKKRSRKKDITLWAVWEGKKEGVFALFQP